MLVGLTPAACTADGTASAAGRSTSPAASATIVVAATRAPPRRHSAQVQVINDHHPSFGAKLAAQGIAVAYIDFTE